jgi:uncharacterized protein YjbI with pentapeptide repeats
LTGQQLRAVGGADFSGANLRGTKFRDAWYDSHTRFPPGFDPKANGMIEVDERGCHV